MKITYKINVYNLLTYLLVFAIIKPYFLPAGLRQASKIIILISVFLFTISREKKERIVNLSWLFSGCVLLSAVMAYLKGGYQDKDFLDALLYAFTFYDIYSFIGLCKQKDRFNETIKCLYNIVGLYCILTIVSILLVGTVNNSNQSAYIFGNKFTSSYLFIFFVALYGATHEMILWKNKICYIALFISSIALIELVAKTARYAEMPLNDYIKEIVTTGLSISEDEIYSSYDRKTDSLINRLKHLYTLQKMTAEEQELLEKFALTPNLYVPFQYREWAGIKKDKLVALINRGWIDKSEDGYKMHPLIKESIIQQEVISISTFEELIDSISNDEFWHCNDEYNKRLIKKQIAKKIIDYFIDVDYKKIWNVISQYCQICLELSDYREAITVLKHAYELCDAEENPDEEDLLTIKLSLAYSYFHACDEKNALYYLALIDKRIEKIQDNDDKLFEIYNLHIILESRLGKIENAKQYFNKICELKITERDFLTAVLNYTSGLIQDKKTDDAMFYMMKFKERFEKEYSNHEAYLATFYSNLAIVYADKDDFQQALAYDQKAYDIRKQVLGTYSKDMAITYISLAEDCLQFNRNDEAKECIIKAEEICKAIFENEDNELYQKVLHAKYVLGI